MSFSVIFIFKEIQKSHPLSKRHSNSHHITSNQISWDQIECGWKEERIICSNSFWWISKIISTFSCFPDRFHQSITVAPRVCCPLSSKHISIQRKCELFWYVLFLSLSFSLSVWISCLCGWKCVDVNEDAIMNECGCECGCEYEYGFEYEYGCRSGWGCRCEYGCGWGCEYGCEGKSTRFQQRHNVMKTFEWFEGKYTKQLPPHHTSHILSTSFQSFFQINLSSLFHSLTHSFYISFSLSLSLSLSHEMCNDFWVLSFSSHQPGVSSRMDE